MLFIKRASDVIAQKIERADHHSLPPNSKVLAKVREMAVAAI